MEENHLAGTGQYQVVARRYRPQNFEELVGQTHIAHALSNAITSGRIGHAYLFTGARGVGKTSTARIYAKALNCIKGSTLTPCGECDSCISISTGDDIDVLEIDAASNRGIEEIRQLRQNASIRPSRSKYKIYILDEVHMLTKEAFNALLKILEEPPEHIKFIFCTTEPSKIPITILSRCQRFDFTGIETNQIADRLASIAEKEKVTADDGVFSTLARRAAGSMRDAQSLLEQLLSFAPEHISMNDVHEMLGTANDQILFRLLDSIQQCNSLEIFTELESAASQGVDFGVLVEQMMGIYRDLLVTVTGGDVQLLLYSPPQQFEKIKTLAQTLGLQRILAAMQILDHAHTRMLRSTQGRVLMELALIRIANLDHFHQISTLLEQLRNRQETQTLPTVKPAQRAIAPPTGQSRQNESVEKLHGTPLKPSSKRDGIEGERTTASCRIGLSRMNDEQAKLIWFQSADSIDGMLGSAAMNCHAVRWEMPNVFVATFINKIVKDQCERGSARLQGVLSQNIGEAVKIRLEMEVPAEPASSGQSVTAQTDRELYLAALENPLVLQIQEAFGVTLHEIKR